MIAHCFISRGDEWILAAHLAAYSTFCDLIAVVLDRPSPRVLEICRRFPKVGIVPWTPGATFDADFNDRGLLCEEGRMRQAAFDAVAAHRPAFVVFGDTDEMPTPDVADFLRSNPDPSVDLWLADWVNLAHNIRTAIGGQRSRWSFQRRENNKKGLILRYRPGTRYVYRQALQHVRMEPNPVLEGMTVIDDTHRLPDMPKLVHYKYANWARWQANGQSRSAAYQDLLTDAEMVAVPAEWLWPIPIPELGWEGSA